MTPQWKCSLTSAIGRKVLGWIHVSKICYFHTCAMTIAIIIITITQILGGSEIHVQSTDDTMSQ